MFQYCKRNLFENSLVQLAAWTNTQIISSNYVDTDSYEKYIVLSIMT